MANLGSTRVFGHAGKGVVAIGMRRRPMRDLYHGLVTGSWTRLLVLYTAVYFLTAAIFGALQLLVSAKMPVAASALASALAGVDASPAPSSEQVSLRALAYSAMAGLEGFVHWVELVIGSGIVLAKFSQVRARVLFSKVAVVGPHEGGTALMFRMANERTSHLVDANVHLMIVRNELSDGEIVRRAHDLDLVRGGSALFALSWTAIHPISRASPLHGQDAASLEKADAELLVTLGGYDEELGKEMHARHVYRADRIRWNARFRDIVRVFPSGERVVDYRRFHDIVPAEGVREDRTPARKAR